MSETSDEHSHTTEPTPVVLARMLREIARCYCNVWDLYLRSRGLESGVTHKPADIGLLTRKQIAEQAGKGDATMYRLLEDRPDLVPEVPAPPPQTRYYLPEESEPIMDVLRGRVRGKPRGGSEK